MKTFEIRTELIKADLKNLITMDFKMSGLSEMGWQLIAVVPFNNIKPGIVSGPPVIETLLLCFYQRNKPFKKKVIDFFK